MCKMIFCTFSIVKVLLKRRVGDWSLSMSSGGTQLIEPLPSSESRTSCREWFQQSRIFT
jgi:hypothetical protein